MSAISIYSTPTCTYCNAAKDFFKEKGVEFDEFDVATDAVKRQEMIEKSGQMGVPVIFVGEEMVIGFDESRLEELIANMNTSS